MTENHLKYPRQQPGNLPCRVADVVQNISGFMHCNTLDDFSLICANKNFEAYFGLTTQKIAEMGSLFIRRYYHRQTWISSLRHILTMGLDHREQKVFGHIQKIRKSPAQPYRFFICTTRVLPQWNCYVTDYVPGDLFGLKSEGIGAINNCMDFIHTNQNKFSSLTPREKEIAHLIGMGKTRSEISNMLFISKLTLDNHRKHIRQKTGAQTTAELLHFIQIFDAFN